jgi:hypothetical protein
MIATLATASLALPSVATAQRPGQQAARADQKPATWPMEQIQGFHVVLVVGETERGQSSTENLTEAAARALKDMSEFLPYKSYRVLDAQWTSCCSGGLSRISGKLQGVIGVPGRGGSMNLVHRPFTFQIIANTSATGIQTRFVLQTADGRGDAHQSEERAEVERMLANVRADIETMRVRLDDTKKRVDVGVAPALELREMQDRLTQLEREAEGLRAKLERAEGRETGVMDSSFTMDAGETVVVGTSKLGGDKALIAIVTAVRKR